MPNKNMIKEAATVLVVVAIFKGKFQIVIFFSTSNRIKHKTKPHKINWNTAIKVALSNAQIKDENNSVQKKAQKAQNILGEKTTPIALTTSINAYI